MSSTPARTRGWLATMPTGWPSILAKPQTRDLAQLAWYSMKSPSSTTSAMTAFMS